MKTYVESTLSDVPNELISINSDSSSETRCLMSVFWGLITIIHIFENMSRAYVVRLYTPDMRQKCVTLCEPQNM